MLRTMTSRAAAMLAVLTLLTAACEGEDAEQATAPDAEETAETQSDTEEPAATDEPAATTEATQVEAAGSCYEGETATFVASFGPGSNYDQIARMIAPFLEEELGATVVVENQEGAGGLLAANSLYTADPDGLTFAFFSGQGIAGSVLGGAEGVQFGLEDFSYVARIAADERLFVVGAQTPYESLEDLRAADSITFASSGPGGSDHIDATVLFPVLAVNGEIITGFEGGPGTELAVTAGDTDAMSGSLSSRLPPVERGEHRALLLIGDERVPELPDVPALLELNRGESEQAIAEAHTNLQAMGRLVLAPPDVPEECLSELRDAFAAAAEDPDFGSQMEAAGLTVNFRGGEEMQQVAQDILGSPEEYVTLLREAYQGQ